MALPLDEALRDSTFYPGAPDRVDVVETHISTVYLAGDLVLKVKKPVVLPFLDYGTPERRRFFCEEEVRLNRRLAPDLYLGVRALVPDGSRLGWRLDDDPDAPGAREYAVAMRRFDEHLTLAGLLDDDRARLEDLRAVGILLADFHSSSSVPADAQSWPRRFKETCAENFTTLTELSPPGLHRQRVAAGRRFTSAFLRAWDGVLRERSAEGRVRDCHGDLRAEHVLLGEPRGLEVFDCVEFDPQLREIDVAADLAFLVMELAAAHREDLAAALLTGYRDAGGDPGPDRLLEFFAAYRAWVRAKVHALRARELESEHRHRSSEDARVQRLSALARRLAWRARGPQVLLVCGPAASGKSFLAEHLASSVGLAHLDSDEVRKGLLGVEATARAPDSAYAEAENERTYGELGRRARALLNAGRSVAVSATFRLRADRASFRAALGDAGIAPLFVECGAPVDVLRQRAQRRLLEARAESDAGPDLAARQAADFELGEVPQSRCLRLTTDRPVEEVADELESFLDVRLAAEGVREKPQPDHGSSPKPGRGPTAKLGT